MGQVEGWVRWGWFIYISVSVGDKWWVLQLVFFTCALAFVLSYPLSLFLSDQSMIVVASVSLFIVFFVSGPINQDLMVHRNCVCHERLYSQYLIIILWISLEKGECFNLNNLQAVCPTLQIFIRLLGRFYHCSLLIRYPCSLV